MVKTINKKPIITDSYINKCKCGRTVKLMRCIWLHEAEAILDMFTFEARRTGKYTLEPKYERRKFFLGICPCGRYYDYKD